MIELLEMKNPRNCNSCYSMENVKELEISRETPNGNVGTVIALCQKCRDKLMSILLADVLKNR